MVNLVQGRCPRRLLHPRRYEHERQLLPRFQSLRERFRAGTWYHVAATHAAGADKLYVNGGTAEASGVAGNFAVSDAANLRLASSQQFSLYTSGLLDEVSFYNSALSASDVDDVYNGGTPTDLGPDGLNLSPVGWWRMGDGDTYDTLTDHGSGGNDGTMKNMLAGDIVAEC